MQGKLLRALGEGRFLPIGSRAAIAVLARVIAACVTDPRELVRTGRLREDLFFRLNVIPIAMPPLRDRREDIPLLAEHFLRRHGRHPDARTTRLQEEDMRLLVEYEWPGNVRELENLVERAIVLGSQSALYSEEMARLRRARPGRRTAPEVDETPREEPELSLAEVERRHILDVLRRCDNNQTRAARILGINPTTLWRKLKAYRDDDPDAV
jgi:transcriptional regulator with PAS, ATPase and Fis domain